MSPFVAWRATSGLIHREIILISLTNAVAAA
jgi:hypothetical protein